MARICIDEPPGDCRTLIERLVARMGHEVVDAHEQPDAVLRCAPEPGAAGRAALVHPFSPAQVRRAVHDALIA